MSADAKKAVLKLDLHDKKAKKKAMKKVSGLHEGIDSLAMDMKEKKLTVIGDVDPAAVVCKLRKCWCTEILSVGPAKEMKPQQPKKPEEAKKKTKKEDDLSKQIAELLKLCQDHKSRATVYHCIHCAEENPDPCVMC